VKWLLLAGSVAACGQSQHGARGTAGAAGSTPVGESGTAGTVTVTAAGASGDGGTPGSGGVAGTTSGHAGATASAGRGGSAVIVETGGQGGDGGAADGDQTRALSYAQWPMPNPASAGLPHPASYDTSTAGIVHDNVTGLEWQRAVPPKMNWSAATAYCAELSLAGKSDWRLPSRIELVSLVDSTRVDPSIDVNAFPDTPTDMFLTLTRGTGVGANNVREVSFAYGKTDWTSESYQAATRCVRADPLNGSPQPRYAVTAETVLDTGTGLVWERVLDFDSAAFFTFDEAPAHCDALTLGGYAAWRVPSIKELQTLAFEGKLNPAIDPQAFPSATPEAYDYWSSSAHPERPGWAFNVRFSDGTSESIPSDLGERVLCVH